ncbi:MAG: arginine--tRNA ligase, partial [Acidobacteriota bacterium]
MPIIDLFADIKNRVSIAVREAFDAAPDPVPLEFPPDPALGDLATPIALGLARSLRRAPREIAAELATQLADVPGVAAVEVAGPGYVNLRIDRTAAVRTLLTTSGAPSASASGGKIIVEHTNI